MKTRILLSLFAMGAIGGAAHAQTLPPAPQTAPETQAPFFRDVPRDHWAFAAVQKLAAAGILEGYGNDAAPAKVAVSPAPSLNFASRVTTITPRTKSALGANSALKGSMINVDAAPQNPLLTLSGTVKSEAQKQLAGAIARKNAPGFTVSNRLRVVR